MNDQFENLNTALDSESFEIPVPDTAEIVATKLNTDIEDTLTSDHEYARENLYGLIEKGQTALDDLLQLAKGSQNHRTYEVAATMMKNLADITDKLLLAQKIHNDIDNSNDTVKKVSGPSTVNNSVFIGSTVELQKMLKDLNKE